MAWIYYNIDIAVFESNIESISKGAGRMDHALFIAFSKVAVGRIVHPRWEGLSYRLLNKSVCLSVCLLSVRSLPSHWGGGGPQLSLYRYTDYSFNQQSVHLSVCSSRGRSRYIDIYDIYTLLIFCHDENFCHDRSLPLGRLIP